MIHQLTVKKSHELVTARYSFNLMEMRLFTLIVSMIQDKDEDFKTYTIPIKNIIQTFGIKNKNIYAEINQLTTSMLKKIIVIPIQEEGKDKEIKTALVSSFKYEVDGRGVLEASFHPVLKPYLLQLKSKFLLYDLKNILKISSWHSIRFYELLKSYEGIGRRVFEVQELKEILCVEDKYAKYANFKKRILLKAQEDIGKHTDIRFTFEEISETSRSVEKLIFNIYKNKKAVIENDEIEEDQTNNSNPSENNLSYDEIKAFGVSKATIGSQIIWNYEEEFIVQTLKYCKNHFKTNAVKQKWGFFLKALKEGYYKEEIDEQITKKVKKAQSKVQQQSEEQQSENLRLEREQKLKILREEFLTPEFTESVIEELQQNNTFMYKLVEKDYGKGIVNKYLQIAIDIRLEKEFGNN